MDSTLLQGVFIASLFILLQMLTTGLAFLLALMETLWFITGRVVYHDMTRYWGQPFAILFGLMLASLVAFIVQLGTHWSPFAHIGGEPFALPWIVALLGGLMPAAVLFALFQQGWTRLTRGEHLAVTWGLVLTTSVALLAEVAAWNGLQDPSAAHMHSGTLRMQIADVGQLFGALAQMRFLHLSGAAYVWVALSMMAVSARWLLHGRDIAFARRSFALAAGFGLAAILAVVLVSTVDRYQQGFVQQDRTALLLQGSAEDTAIAPGLALPGLLEWVATDRERPQLPDPESRGRQIQQRITQAAAAEEALQLLRERAADEAVAAKTLENFAAGRNLLGYLPLSDGHMLAEADAWALPDAKVVLAFRLMVWSGVLLLLLFLAAFVFCHRRQAWAQRGLLRIVSWAWPLPLLAIAAGWVFSEAGRWPWLIAGTLPLSSAQTALPLSSTSFSLAAYLLFLGLPMVLGLLLIGRMLRQGPSLLATGRYHFEGGVQTSWLGPH